MLEIEIVKKNGIDVVDSKLLHKQLGVASYHSDWIRRRIDGYSFEDGKDYYLSHHSTLRGGTKRKDYLLTLDMAKELAMLENNETGKAIRRYFIKAEKQLRKLDALRIAGIESRKELTDIVDQCGENERMHGRGYSNYTRMVYQITGVYDKFKEWKKESKSTNSFRDSLSVQELKRVNLAESMIKPLLEMDKQYADIKSVLEPLFSTKDKVK